MVALAPPAPPVPSRVLITGAAGFIGGAVAQRYRALGCEVRGVDLEADPAAGIVAGDVSRPGPWEAQARGCELVVHCAAKVSLRARSTGFWELNVAGTRRVLEAAVRGGARRLLFLSSITVFGWTFPPEVDERWPVRPNGVPYVDTKIAGEQVVLAAHAAGEIEATVVRPGDVYGPRSRPWTILPVELLRARRFVLPARGRGIIAPIYIDNLVDGIVLAAGRPEGAGQVLNLTDGADLQTRRFFGHYARMLGRRRVPSLPTGPAARFAALDERLAGLRRTPTEVNANSARYLARRHGYSRARARELLGFAPRVDLGLGMARTEVWLREAGLL